MGNVISISSVDIWEDLWTKNGTPFGLWNLLDFSWRPKTCPDTLLPVNHYLNYLIFFLNNNRLRNLAVYWLQGLEKMAQMNKNTQTNKVTENFEICLNECM